MKPHLILTICIIVTCIAAGVLRSLAKEREGEDERAPIPAVARQAEVTKLLDDTYGISTANTPANQQQAAKALMDAVSSGDLASDELYVVLTSIMRLSREAGDFTQYWNAACRLDASFRVDGKEQYLGEFLKEGKVNAALKSAVDQALLESRLAVSRHRFAQARLLLDSADATIRRAKLGSSLAKTVAESQKALSGQETQWKSYQNALAMLDRNPGDVAASSTVGRWHVLYEADWETGLPYLAKGGDPKWKAASELELKGADSSSAQVAVADAWWDIAQVETGDTRTALLAHAKSWYERALPSLTSLQKQRVAKRLGETESVKVNNAAPKNETTSIKDKPISEDNRLATGEWINLLDMVKLPEHALLGRWSRDDTSLICEPSWHARFMPPVMLQGSYELDCDFTRTNNAGALKMTLPLDSTHCNICLSGWDGAVHGLQLVDGHECKTLGTASGAASRPGTLKNNQKYRLEVKVVQEGPLVDITALLDSQRLIAWKGGINRLSCPPDMALPCMNTIGISAHDSQFTIHKLRLRLKRGTKGFRFDSDWQSPLSMPASSPAKELAARCVTWSGRKYFVSLKPMDFVSAQRMAAQMKGRLLTISTVGEEEFIMKEFPGRVFWTAAWRREDSHEWGDERNRPLKYIAKWGPRQPDNGWSGRETLFVINTMATPERGLHDVPPWESSHACIEWGEEYPGK